MKMYDCVYLVKIMNGSYNNDDGTMSLGQIATSKCINGSALNDDSKEARFLFVRHIKNP